MRAAFRGSVSYFGLGMVLAAGIASQAQAQTADTSDKVETVVVTAEKRAEPLQNVPIAVTALTGQKLTEMGGSDLADFAGAIPGLSFQNDRAGENSTTIRGISEIGGTAPSVGVYIDEIPVTAVTGEQVNLKSFDVDRIEVLRGPQGTLYGEGSEGGTIRVITNHPSADAFDGALRATGSYTDHGGLNGELDGEVNIPIVSDELAIRLVGLSSDYDGWTTNPDIGAKHYNKNESTTFRAAARFTPDSKWTIDVSYIHQYSKSDGPSASDHNYVYAVPTAEPRNDRYDIYNLTIARDLGFATLTSATGYFERSSFSHNDFSSEAPLASFIFGTPISTVAITRPNDQKTFTEELRLVSNPGGGPLEWTVGGFYEHNNLFIANSTITNPAETGVFNLSVGDVSRQYAGFGEATYALTDRLKITGGVRYFEQDRDTNSSVSGLVPLLFTGVGFNNLTQKATASDVTSKISLSYDVTDTALVYATASSGFRAGDINPYAFMFPGAPASFGPEKLWNYEVGAKTSWFNDRLVANGDLFYIDWNNVIVDASAPNPLFGYSFNAGKAHSEGAELELTAVPITGLELSLSESYTEAKIDSVNPGAAAVAGETLPFVPRFKTAVGAQYTFPLFGDGYDGRVRADLFSTSKTYSLVSNVPSSVSKGYAQINLRAGIVAGTWDLMAFVDNVSGTKGELSASLSETGTDQWVFIRPRTVGLTLNKHF
jgi:outer membrane receptor protein involved in Fe transport